MTSTIFKNVVVAGFLLSGSLAFLPQQQTTVQHHSSPTGSYTSSIDKKSTQKLGITWGRSQQQFLQARLDHYDTVSADDDDHDDKLVTFCQGEATTNGRLNDSIGLVTKSIASVVSQYATLAITTAMAVLLCASMSFGATTVAWADDTTSIKPTQTSLLLQESPKQQLRESNLVDEVGGLINKYYVDRTYNGQDWNKVQEKYYNLAKGADDTKSMKLVTEMVQSLGDKYSRMLDVQQYSAIQKYDLIGVGVTLMPNSQKQIIVGAPPIEGSPSAKAGLKSGDFVTEINGISTNGRSAFDIIDQISEEPNAKTVTFTIQRQGVDDLPGEGSTQVVTMDRQTMQVKDPIQYKVSEVRKDGTKVGYIRLSEFNALVKAQLEGALADLEKQGVNAYVLDLRMNTGGAFQSAVEISSLFLEDRIATYVVDGNAVELPFRTAKGRLAIDKSDPMVIWIDGTSASASEVLAGSLHDNCRAVTMGSKSFGKGLIQAVYGLKNGAGLVLTVAKYVTPSGGEIQGIGITPDIEGGVPAPPIIPVLSTDTTQVNFKDITKRLESSMCHIPDDRVTTSKEQVQQ